MQVIKTDHFDQHMKGQYVFLTVKNIVNTCALELYMLMLSQRASGKIGFTSVFNPLLIKTLLAYIFLKTLLEKHCNLDFSFSRTY